MASKTILNSFSCAFVAENIFLKVRVRKVGLNISVFPTSLLPKDWFRKRTRAPNLYSL